MIYDDILSDNMDEEKLLASIKENLVAGTKEGVSVDVDRNYILTALVESNIFIAWQLKELIELLKN